MKPYYADEAVTLYHGDNREVLKHLDANSLDACVTDPPYELGFMGRHWDASGIAYDKYLWAEVWRVLKPGGHLLAFGGTRTWHRLAVAIEDAGFEVRDNVAYLHDGGLPGPMCWAFGSGFPKSHNVSKALRGQRCECDQIDWPYEAVPAENVRGVRASMDADDSIPGGAQPHLLQDVREPSGISVNDGAAGVEQVRAADLPGVRQDVPPLADETARGSSSDMLAPVQGGGVPGRAGRAVSGRIGGTEDAQAGPVGREEPGVEGRRDVQAPEGELRRPALREVPAGVPSDGTFGRLRDGAPSGDGAVDGSLSASDGGRESHQPRPAGQSTGEPGTVPEQRGPQARRGWPLCSRCGKPEIPDGLGTALKPAHEPIVVARKPLIGTVAANVLEHGTGALNMDGCRIKGEHVKKTNGSVNEVYGDLMSYIAGQPWESPAAGRWPANVILDESQAQALDRKSGVTAGRVGMTQHGSGTNSVYGTYARTEQSTVVDGTPDTGGASRFFYTAKANSTERPRVDGIAHPTVKPLDLMQYLVRLVTPSGGTVLEPFAGSGTTAEACIIEGFRCIAIEMTDDYLPLIMQRISKPIEVTLL